MDIVGLKSEQGDWRYHRFESRDDMQAALSRRDIHLANNVRLGRFVLLGDGARVG